MGPSGLMGPRRAVLTLTCSLLPQRLMPQHGYGFGCALCMPAAVRCLPARFGMQAARHSLDEPVTTTPRL